MQINKNTIKMLLALNDNQLMEFVKNITEKHGVDLSTFNITSNDINSIRNGLKNAGDDDIKKAVEIMNNYKH